MYVWITNGVSSGPKIMPAKVWDCRAEAFANGQDFIAGGWKLRPSSEGISWHRTPEAAVERMNALREEYISKLRASIKKYEAVVYTAQKAK